MPNDDVDFVSIQAALDILLGNHTSFNSRVQSVQCTSIDGYPRVKTSFYYLSFRDGLPTVTEFVDYLKWQMVPFCIPRRDRIAVENELEKATDFAEKTRLVTGVFEKAKSLFIKAQKQQKKAGEPAELILFVLLEWALKAPQLVSKMYLKTSVEMPVHGSDGIHACLDSDGKTLLLYFGESKMYEQISGALDAAFDSIMEFSVAQKESREVDIVRDHINLGEDQDALKNALLSYLNPYTRNGDLANERRTVFACYIGFDTPHYEKIAALDPNKIEDEFKKLVNERLPEILGLLKSRLAKNDVININFQFFLMPFPSVADFRKSFFNHVGINYAE